MHMKKGFVITALLISCFFTSNTFAQDAEPKRSPDELRELFGFCDKPILIKLLKISDETADKIGEIDYWARLQQISIDANTNEVYATTGELMQEVAKKYKAFLSAEQVKTVMDMKKANANNPSPCAAITLEYNKIFDTMSPQRALLLYKTNRKALIDKLGINGRQADMLFETEVWKQIESLSISNIPVTDFNRIRRTVAMYKQRESRYKAIGLTDEQIETTIQFFKEHQLGSK